MRILLVLALALGANLSARAADGVLDTTFGTGGIAFTGLTDALGNGAYGPIIQPDGKILICDTRTADGTSGHDFFVARFTAAGTLDTSFSFDGKVTIDFDGGTGADYCTAIALQTDGKIVVAGYTYGASGNNDFAVARLNSDGTLDTTGFGAGTGKTTVAFDLGGTNTDQATAIAIQPDGKIVIAGTVQTASNGTDFGVVRLNTDGTRDSSFNLTGKVTVGFDLAGSTTKNDVVTSVAIDAAGNIVLGGSADKGTTNNDFAVARLLPNGQLDANFDADGRATVAFDLGGVGGSNDDEALGMTIQRDGNIVLVGASDTSSTSTPNYDVSVARLRPDGSLDSGFGIGGKTLVSFDLIPNGTDVAVGVAEQDNGKLVLVGFSLYSSTPYAVKATAVRLNANATLDNQFGMLGKEIFDFGLTSPSSQVLRGVAFQGTQIIASGGAVVPGGTGAIDDFVIRLQNDLIFADGFE
jgi:uncharacterized delta-60 repeat protein